MTLFDSFFQGKTLEKRNVGIGLGNSSKQNIKILEAAHSVLKKYDLRIILYGTKVAIDEISDHFFFEKNKFKLTFKCSENSENDIINDILGGYLHAIVRGSLSSSKFLESLKDKIQVEKINRMALLESADSFQFFYGPVGIDECNTFEQKRDFINLALQIFHQLALTPHISILSGGRKGDLGRDANVDRSINTALEVVDFFERKEPDLRIRHDEILIEKSLELGSNLIIAPDGISGNLIYRTLVHLGKGKAYGAIYMGLDKIIIDTSRVGELSELIGALSLAYALCQ